MGIRSTIIRWHGQCINMPRHNVRTHLLGRFTKILPWQITNLIDHLFPWEQARVNNDYVSMTSSSYKYKPTPWVTSKTKCLLYTNISNQSRTFSNTKWPTGTKGIGGIPPVYLTRKDWTPIWWGVYNAGPTEFSSLWVQPETCMSASGERQQEREKWIHHQTWMRKWVLKK